MSLSLLLRCRDLDETRRFYRTVLGFEVADSPGPTLTARLQGGTLIFTAQDLWSGGPACSGTAYFTLADVDDYFARCQQRRAPLAWPLQEMSYGSREFGITDCNGYTLAFQQQR